MYEYINVDIGTKNMWSGACDASNVWNPHWERSNFPISFLEGLEL